MSDTYGVGCADCNDCLYDAGRNNEMLVKNWPQIKAAIEALKTLDGYYFEWEVSWLGRPNDTSISDVYEFLNEHYGHDLRETTYGQMGKPFEGYTPSVKPMGEINLNLKDNRLSIEVPPDRYDQLINLLKIGK